MKPYLNPESETLKRHREGIHKNSSVYFEITRPKNTTRIWVSYDIKDEEAPEKCREKLEAWLKDHLAESFGNSIATFLLKGQCFSTNSQTAKWLINQLKEAEVLGEEDSDSSEKSQFLHTPGLSLYVIYRSRNEGDGDLEKLYSGHFVLIQNTPIANEGGY